MYNKNKLQYTHYVYEIQPSVTMPRSWKINWIGVYFRINDGICNARNSKCKSCKELLSAYSHIHIQILCIQVA